jgi:hypothetical protein
VSQAYTGGCHCGRVRFRVTAPLEKISRCNCSMCAKKGFVHWIVEPRFFELLSGRDELSTYAFNTRVARHHFCRHCGIHSFYVPRSDPDKIDVNVRCVDDLDADAIEAAPFDGKHWEEAIQRR